VALHLDYTPRGIPYAAPTCTVDQYPAAALALAEVVDDLLTAKRDGTL
jgi:hypothetical protein